MSEKPKALREEPKTELRRGRPEGPRREVLDETTRRRERARLLRDKNRVRTLKGR